MFRFMLTPMAVLAFAGSALAQDLDESTAAKLRTALDVGKDINAHDQSAWHVTDALMETRPDPKGKGIIYVTERLSATQVETTFLSIDGKDAMVFFSGVVEGSDVVSTRDFTRDLKGPPATPGQVARAKALLAAQEAFSDGVCGNPPNYVVLDSAMEGALDVYVLAPETRSGIVQLGGHQRITVDASSQIMSDRTKLYANSCLAVKVGKDVEALMVTLPENIGDTPTEIHVFKSLSHDIPIYVATATGTWAVEGSRIRLLTGDGAN